MPYNYGFGWTGDVTSGQPFGLAALTLAGLDGDLRGLPEDVRAEIEARRNQFRNEEDLRALTRELMLRR